RLNNLNRMQVVAGIQAPTTPILNPKLHMDESVIGQIPKKGSPLYDLSQQLQSLRERIAPLLNIDQIRQNKYARTEVLPEQNPVDAQVQTESHYNTVEQQRKVLRANKLIDIIDRRLSNPAATTPYEQFLIDNAMGRQTGNLPIGDYGDAANAVRDKHGRGYVQRVSVIPVGAGNYL
ncbi:MAG: hypothetical protein HQL03_08600, partial [Nitrospirae bacterium]|nr:hypothetical protein [Nitrospirota bacterium]